MPRITVIIKLKHVGNIILYDKSLYNINLLPLPNAAKEGNNLRNNEQ